MGIVVVGMPAHALREQHDVAISALMARAVERLRTRGPAAGRPIQARLFDEQEIARQALTSDGWATLGLVARDEVTLLLEVNALTGEGRIVVPPADRSSSGPWPDVVLAPEALAALATDQPVAPTPVAPRRRLPALPPAAADQPTGLVSALDRLRRARAQDRSLRRQATELVTAARQTRLGPRSARSRFCLRD